jgi:hypothetical protein
MPMKRALLTGAAVTLAFITQWETQLHLRRRQEC